MFTKRSKKLIILLMVCLLITMSILVGCGSDDNNKSSPDVSKDVEKKDDEKKDDEKKDDEKKGEETADEVSYPMADGDLTLKMWMPISATALKYITTYAENEAFIRVMEDTGVNIDFIHPPAGEASEHFNLMIASRELPDIIIDNKYKGDVVQGVRDGIFEDLTDLVPKYAPDYNKLLEEYEDFRREVTTHDNKIYGLYLFKDVETTFEGEYRRTNFRKDWLDEWEMDIPVTFDEYEAYFKKVLETKPGVAPFMLTSSGIERHFLAPFDMSNGYYLTKPFEDGKIMWYGADPNYKEYLTLMHDWYKAGYISKDFTTGEAQKLFLSGEVGSVLDPSSVNLFPAAKELGVEITTGPYVRKEHGQKIHVSYRLFLKNSNSYNGTVTTSSEHKPEALKFLNYGYTDEGWKTYSYGPRDIAWTEDSNGQPIYTDHVLDHPKYSITDVDSTIRLHTGMPRIRDSDRLSIPANMKDPGTLEYRLLWADDPDVDGEAVLPPFFLTPEQSNDRTNIMNDIDTYVKEMTLKFITGAEPLSNFDKFHETVKSMGVDEAIRITQEAYDTHMTK